jgi:hypothetical protein
MYHLAPSLTGGVSAHHAQLTQALIQSLTQLPHRGGDGPRYTAHTAIQRRAEEWSV